MATLADLPAIPDRGWGNGLAWMDEARGWVALQQWGRGGWPLGNWPDIILMITSVHVNLGTTQAYGVATYVGGDVSVEAFDTEEEAIVAVDLFAAWYWRGLDPAQQPHGCPHGEGPLGQHLCGPYSRSPHRATRLPVL